MVHDYASADTFLHTRGKPVPRKKFANNTYLHRTHDRGVYYIHLRLHDTDVVTWSMDGLIVLNTGGWLTVTTKDRINSVLPPGFMLVSTKGVWSMRKGGWQDGVEVCRYQDGLQMRRGHQGWGVVLDTAPTPTDTERHDAHNAMVRKLVGRYIKALPETTIGDCTLCRSADIVTGDNGRSRWITYGDQMGDTQHLVDHVVNGVLSTDLVYAALGERGYLMHLTHSSDTVKRAVRAYLSNRLLIGSATPAHGRKPVLPTGVPA